MQLCLMGSQGDSALPGNEIGLPFGFGAGENFAAGGANHQIENAFAHSFDGGFAGDDGPGIDVDAVRHFFGQLGIGGELDDRRDGIAGRSAEPGGKED